MSAANKAGFDLKKSLLDFTPNLFNLIQGEISWRSINKQFDKKLQRLEQKKKKGERIILRTNIYIEILSAERGEEEGKSWVSFINLLAGDLANHLNKNEKRLIAKIIKDLLYFDDDFLNYLGELLVLNCFMKKGIYSLIATEYKESKAGSIDFKFCNKQTEENLLIEVVNIELNATKLIDKNSTKLFFDDKFSAKLEDTDIKSGITNYSLFPVFWGGKEDVIENTIRLKHFFEETNYSYPRVLTPFIYYPYFVKNKLYHKFCKITSTGVHDNSLL